MKNITDLRTPITFLTVVSLCTVNFAAAQAFIEDFNDGEPTSFWKSGGKTFVSDLTDNSQGALNLGGGGFSKYTLPFDDALSGAIFSLSFDWSINGSLFTKNNIAFYAGFGTGTGDGGAAQNQDDGFNDNELAYGFRLSNADYTDGDDQDSLSVSGYAGDGPNTGGINDFQYNITRASGTDTWTATFRIDVDAPNERVTYYVDDQVVGSTDGPVTNIGGVWFKMDQGSDDAYFIIDDVSVVIPEPSAYALIAGLLGLSWVMVRRRVSRRPL